MYPYFCFFISILRWKRKTKYYSDIARWPDWGYARLKGWREKSQKRGSGGAFAEWTHDIKVLSLCYSLSSCVRSRGWKRVTLGREWSSDFTREFPWRQKQSLLFCEVRHASHNYPCKKKVDVCMTCRTLRVRHTKISKRPEFCALTSRFVPMDLSYSDDSNPGSDVSYPLSISSYPTLWSIRTQQLDTKCLKQT